jgi:AcrR family transcriptional regulator
MHEHLDLRVKKTRDLVRKTLIDLIEEKGFDAVTVGDIAERAMINRSTFYRHYPDKYALVTSIFEDAVNQLLIELGQEQLEALDWIVHALGTQSNSTSPEMKKTMAAWVSFFEHFVRHAKLYRAMLGKQGSSWFSMQMRNYAASALHQRLHASPWYPIWQKNSSHFMPEEVAVMSLANWIVGMITWWLEDGIRYTPFQIATWSLQYIGPGYVSALGIDVSMLFPR